MRVHVVWSWYNGSFALYSHSDHFSISSPIDSQVIHSRCSKLSPLSRRCSLHFSLKYLSRGEEDNSLRSVCTPFSDTSFVSLVTFDKVIDRFLALFLFLFIAQSHENNQRTRRCSLVSDSHLSVVEMSFCYLNFSQSTLGLLWTAGNQSINEICNCLKSFTLSYYRK